MIILLLALIGALIVMVILTIGRLFFGRKEKFDGRKFGLWFVRYFIFNYLFCLVAFYLFRPALTGPFWGWQWLFWPLLFSSIANLFGFARPAAGMLEEITLAASQRGTFRTTGVSGRRSTADDFSRGAVAAAILGLVIAGVIGIVAPLLITVFTTWFDVNAKALAAIANVRMQNTDKLPPTDPNHIVLVSESVAAYKGQQVLGSSGQNLGSAYGIDPDGYALQSIKGHLYYVAPLSYNNIFVNLSSPTTPGFVVVDAENPQAVPQLRTEGGKGIPAGTSLAYLPGALLNQDLLRHVYLNGYTSGRLVDPTLEVDDSFHPYWTVSVMQPIRGYVGDVLSQVLIIDAHTGEIVAYNPQEVPDWVDRVMPASTVKEYLGWWGLYHDAPWFNPSGLGRQTPASDPQLLYNSVDQPVWLIPMTSSSAKDNSSTGVFLFNTHKNEAIFYPLAGLGIGNNVIKTFESTRANIRNYDVSSVQLYQIYNTPTWVAIYTQSTGGSPSSDDKTPPRTTGGIFQAVGIVDARNLNGSNVQFDTSLSQALQSYQQWLTQQGSSGNVPSGGKEQTTTGKVLRISPVQAGGNTIYYLQIEGQKVIFTANLSLSPELPLVQPGDTVTGTYLDTGGTVVNFKTFDDVSINLNGSNSAPNTTPTTTPAVTPSAGAKPKP
jgi:hypothetical protein